jgi:hypothetical protein
LGSQQVQLCGQHQRGLVGRRSSSGPGC